MALPFNSDKAQAKWNKLSASSVDALDLLKNGKASQEDIQRISMALAKQSKLAKEVFDDGVDSLQNIADDLAKKFKERGIEVAKVFYDEKELSKTAFATLFEEYQQKIFASLQDIINYQNELVKKENERYKEFKSTLENLKKQVEDTYSMVQEIYDKLEDKSLTQKKKPKNKKKSRDPLKNLDDDFDDESALGFDNDFAREVVRQQKSMKPSSFREPSESSNSPFLYFQKSDDNNRVDTLINLDRVRDNAFEDFLDEQKEQAENRKEDDESLVRMIEERLGKSLYERLVKAGKIKSPDEILKEQLTKKTRKVLVAQGANSEEIQKGVELTLKRLDALKAFAPDEYMKLRNSILMDLGDKWSERINKKLSNSYRKTKDFLSSGWSWFKKIAIGVLGVSFFWPIIKSQLIPYLEKALPEMKESFGNFFETQVLPNVEDLAKKLVTNFPEIVDDIGTITKEVFKAITSLGGAILKGLLDGINDLLGIKSYKDFSEFEKEQSEYSQRQSAKRLVNNPKLSQKAIDSMAEHNKYMQAAELGETSRWEEATQKAKSKGLWPKDAEGGVPKAAIAPILSGDWDKAKAIIGEVNPEEIKKSSVPVNKNALVSPTPVSSPSTSLPSSTPIDTNDQSTMDGTDPDESIEIPTAQTSASPATSIASSMPTPSPNTQAVQDISTAQVSAPKVVQNEEAPVTSGSSSKETAIVPIGNNQMNAGNARNASRLESDLYALNLGLNGDY